MESKWTSYWYVCTNCDTSIEITTKRTVNPDPKCTCKNSGVVLCQKTLAVSR